MRRATRILFGWLVGIGLLHTASAQQVGTCGRAQAEAYLGVGEVRARIVNTGGLFYRGLPNVYEVPKGDGVQAIFASNIWIGGKVDGEIRVSATRYGEWELWPGPLDADGNPPVDCALYDRLWEMTREDLERFEQYGEVSLNLRTWPAHLGAPVVDGDSIAGNYNLEGGDRPALVGDQMLWTVMNDAGNEHESTKSKPLGMEVHATAFAFADSPATMGRQAVRQATFYRYRFIYKGKAPLDSAYISVFVDPDLRNFGDDYIGVDTTLALGYTYNGDDNDESTDDLRGYGLHPPALGYVLLKGPLAKGIRLPLTHFIMRPRCADCHISPDWKMYYNFMRGRWPRGQSLTYGGDGRGYSNVPVNHVFPGDPVTGVGWSELNPAGDGSLPPIDPADRDFIMSTGPFTMQPGDEQEIVFAVIWTRGKNNLHSVTRLRDVAEGMRAMTDDLLHPYEAAPAKAPAPEFTFAPSYPNPFRGTTTLHYSLPEAARVRLVVYDVLGREVAHLVDKVQAAGAYTVAFDAEELPSGMYVGSLEVAGHRFTQPLIVH